MATPTPGKYPMPTAVATPPVSTPFSASNHPLAFSPHGPRSVVPSPQQLRKSPANSNTMYGYPGGGHPTHSTFAGYDSPSAAMALGGVPGLDMGLDGLGGSGMGMGIGTPMAMGIGGLGGNLGRGEEDERRRRLEMVVEILKVSKGRLSENGMERLARRVGLECIWDPPQLGSGGIATRTLIIAGSALALDIDFADNVVKKVSLSFPESPEIVTKHTAEAEGILLRDLQFQKGESPLTKKLDRFAANLERLAQLDKLSVIPGLNCGEAIAGLYESLERLHAWEVERLKEGEMAGREEGYVVKTAMCTRSGRPVMHTRDRVGLSLDYWQEKRRLNTKKEEKTWSLLVECAPSPGLVYTPLRVSKDWISAEVKATATAEEILLEPNGGPPVLDWLEPENTLLPADPPKADMMDVVDAMSGPKLPEVMFLAKFDPPLIVPYALAAQIYRSTNVTVDPFQTTTFDGLLFPHAPEDIDNNESRRIERSSTVHVFSNGEKSTIQQKNELWIEKIEYGCTLAELPFSHPRQLVEMLPALRQYAFLATLLAKSFGPASKPPSQLPAKLEIRSKKLDFAAFMAGGKAEARRTMDVSISTHPVPRLRVVFPWQKGTGDVTFEIGMNGAVGVVAQNLVDAGVDGMGQTRGVGVSDLGAMLEVCEDLGVWVEFVGRRLG